MLLQSEVPGNDTDQTPPASAMSQAQYVGDQVVYFRMRKFEVRHSPMRRGQKGAQRHGRGTRRGGDCGERGNGVVAAGLLAIHDMTVATPRPREDRPSGRIARILSECRKKRCCKNNANRR
jgi:hypothetical protein